MQKTKEQAGEDFWQRIESLIGEERPYSWCARVGINKGSFQSAYNRRSRPLDQTINKWADKIGVSSEWLKMGLGQPYPGASKADQSVQAPKQDCEESVSSVTDFRHVEDWDDDTPVEADEVPIPFYKNLRFACGDGSASMVMADEQRKLRMSRRTLNRLNIQPSNVLAAVASDGSMSPTINDGNTIFIDRGHDTIRDGKVFAIEHGGLFRCKRLYEMPNGGVRIVSDNDDEYPTIHLSADDQKDQHFCIVGWVFSWSVIDSW